MNIIMKERQNVIRKTRFSMDAFKFEYVLLVPVKKEIEITLMTDFITGEKVAINETSNLV